MVYLCQDKDTFLLMCRYHGDWDHHQGLLIVYHLINKTVLHFVRPSFISPQDLCERTPMTGPEESSCNHFSFYVAHLARKGPRNYYCCVNRIKKNHASPPMT